MKCMVIDGNSIINRAYYGIRPLTNREGLYTHAVFGFLTTLLRLKEEERPDALCVTFDLHAPTFRHKADEAYKATRKPMPEELRMQVPVLKEVLDTLNIPRYEMEGWEADDLIGTISRKCEAAGWDCVVVTGDKDSLQLITEHTKVVAITHVGNTTGAITDIAPIIRRAHEVGAIFILDACQSVPHLKVDFHALDVDFAAWSAHKMYGPTGVGFLYGRRELLEALPPANFGGSMVELAWMDQPAQYMVPPARFEAGTQPVAQVVAAGVAAEWMMNVGLENIEAHERTIAAELLKMGDIDGVRILGPRENVNRIGTVAFDVAGVHPHDVGQFIDAQGIAIRVGHHCAQPVHRHFGLYASNRASSGVYNSVDDAHALVEAVAKVRPFFGL